MIPKYFFLTKGLGKHKEYLQSFELALRKAGIQYCNLVNVSSIIPPRCKLISREKGLKLIKPGEITFAVISKNSTNKATRIVTASIGVALTHDKEKYGYLSEHHSFGQSSEVSGDYVEDLAAAMLATTMGIQFNPKSAEDKRKQLFKTTGLNIETSNITQSATGAREGLWTTVIAAAVFII